jgi:NTP pyrophosphatase (non-canonical NTP hydrolase)
LEVSLKLNKYQKLAHKTASPDADRVMAILGLCGEVGELADIYKKVGYHGHKLDIPKVKFELGDILWYLAEACTQFGFELDDVAAANLLKLQERYGDAFSAEASINRAQD